MIQFVSIAGASIAYRVLGKMEKARRDFEKALKIDPGFEQGMKNLAGLPSRP